MEIKNKVFLFIKKSACFNCSHYDICKFANNINIESTITTKCSNRNELICENKK